MNNNTQITLIFSTLLNLNVILPNAGQFIRQGKCLARLCPCFMLTFLDVIFPKGGFPVLARSSSQLAASDA